MMIQEITEENVEDYLDFVPEELLGEVKREYWHGFAGTEDEVYCKGSLRQG